MCGGYLGAPREIGKQAAVPHPWLDRDAVGHRGLAIDLLDRLVDLIDLAGHIRDLLLQAVELPVEDLLHLLLAAGGRR